MHGCHLACQGLPAGPEAVLQQATSRQGQKSLCPWEDAGDAQ